MTWLDNVFSNELSEDGTPVPQRKRVDFVGVTIEDVPAEDLTRVTITGGGGVELSDSPPRPIGTTSAAGGGTKAADDKHVHAHGDLAGGSLHAVAEPSVGGVGGSAGFATAAMAEKLGAIPAWATAATPDTLVLRTADGSIAAVNATCTGTATVTGACTAGSLVSSSLSHATLDLSVTASGAGKAVVINGAGGAYLRHSGANIAATTASSFLLFRSAVFDGSFNGTFGFLAAGSTPGKTATLAGQSVTTGTGGAVIIQAGTGSVKSGEVQISGDVIRGVSNGFAWMTPDTYTKASISAASGASITAKGHKFQVNDATTPATVRTVLEVVREAGGVGTWDKVTIDGAGFYAGYDGANHIDLDQINNTFRISLDGAGGLYGDGSNHWEASGEWSFIDPVKINGSTATAGQIRLVDGEILNAKGSGGSEVCLVSYDRTLTSAVFGSDGAGARSAVTAVLAGSTSAQMVANGAAVVEARAGQAKVSGAQFCEEVATSATISATTATLDAALGNVHVVPLSATSTCTISLSNTKKGAEMEFFFTKSGSGVGVTLSPTWFDMGLAVDYTNPTGSISNVIAFGSRTRIYIRGRVQADGGKVFVTHHVEN